LSTARNIGGEDLGQITSIRQVGVAAFIGAMIEWYDFFLYGLAAAVVFNQLFFPSETPLAGTLTAFATFGVGFFFRPVGGAIFGHYGDKLGRKTILVLTLLIMGVATFLIGLLPTYDTIGILAPILLVVLRIFQGIGVGGEWSGAALMVVEHAPLRGEVSTAAGPRWDLRRETCSRRAPSRRCPHFRRSSSSPGVGVFPSC
jgi:MFS transporter, MHS family, shikimate and dehydroshikimate transport protein